jgi:hypothetical protein
MKRKKEGGKWKEKLRKGERKGRNYGLYVTNLFSLLDSGQIPCVFGQKYP